MAELYCSQRKTALPSGYLVQKGRRLLADENALWCTRSTLGVEEWYFGDGYSQRSHSRTRAVVRAIVQFGW
jgi:hypothetical protein